MFSGQQVFIESYGMFFTKTESKQGNSSQEVKIRYSSRRDISSRAARLAHTSPRDASPPPRAATSEESEP